MSRLGRLERLGEGGDGVVSRTSLHPASVYKEFRKELLPEVDTRALAHLIERFASFDRPTSAWISPRTVWPRTLVYRNRRVSGFLMPLIPQECFVRYGARAYPKLVELDWNRLILRRSRAGNANIVSDLPSLNDAQLVDLLRDLFRTASLLHSQGFILGDISGRNLLWRIAPSIQVVIIDNDGFREVGGAAVTRPKQSPDWEDPRVRNGETSQESDRFKLALAAYRCVWERMRLPAQGDSVDGAETPLKRCLWPLILETLFSSARPPLGDWIAALDKADRERVLEGRPMIQVELPDRRTPMVSVPVSARPIISLPARPPRVDN